MKQSTSQTRRKYEAAYKRLRLYGGWLDGEPSFRLMDEESECALESYDYHDSEFSGWINRHRMRKFIYHKMILAGWEGLPF